MTTSGDKHLRLFSGPFPGVETLVMSEGLRSIRTSGGSGSRRFEPKRVILAGPAPGFSLLPQPASRWKSLAASLLTQTAGLMVLLCIPMFIVERLAVQEFETTALLPPQTLTLRPDPAPLPLPRVKAPSLKLEDRARPVILRAPRLVARAPIEVPAPEVRPVFQPIPLVDTPRPPRPRPEVRTGVLAAANAPLPRVELPAAKVQTGGFGNPVGQAGQARPGRLTVDRVGSFDLPSGPGLGNSSSGSKGAPGIVTNAGFGKAPDASPSIAVAAGGSAVRTGAFGDARTTTAGTRKPEGPAPLAMKPVEILSKPTPAYTEEARRLRKEGEVLLEVVFTAAGEVQVLRVLQGLGYGLDESAVQAAKKVRFRPAQHDGQPVDSTAKLHILFQLAY